jgi:arsenate reductase (thioredoxin)
MHNSARSQMAEAFLKKHGASDFYVESAGITPGELNLNVVRVMKEAGIDISGNRTKSVEEFLKRGTKFNYVITVCGEAEGSCPFFPGAVQYLRWPFPDPSKFTGDDEEVLTKVREVRDAIEKAVIDFVKMIS